jgi:tRNA (guanosine-2'-O-)-methyltransferase
MDQQLIDYLSGFVTPRRLQLFERVLSQRTRYITVVLEDIYQSHNASAVLRSCDCFGIQDVHIIENRNDYKVNPDVALGSNKWLTLTRYRKREDNTGDAIASLRKSGYRIVATTSHADSVRIHEFDLRPGKVALLFGTELRGLSESALKEADEYLTIPMAGFTESLNISVSVAVTLFKLTETLRSSNLDWSLTPEECREIRLNWLRETIKKVELLEKDFVERSRSKRTGQKK